MAGSVECVTVLDFESENELQHLAYQCHTWFEIDNRYATSGSRSLRVELYPPAQYPGLRFKDLKRQWKGIKQVRLDIYNPDSADIFLIFRIDDRPDNPPYSDRVNYSFILRPGLNKVVLDLASLKTSGTGRHLDIEKINKFMFFVSHPQKPLTIFVDNIRLCKER